MGWGRSSKSTVARIVPWVEFISFCQWIDGKLWFFFKSILFLINIMSFCYLLDKHSNKNFNTRMICIGYSSNTYQINILSVVIYWIWNNSTLDMFHRLHFVNHSKKHLKILSKTHFQLKSKYFCICLISLSVKKNSSPVVSIWGWK